MLSSWAASLRETAESLRVGVEKFTRSQKEQFEEEERRLQFQKDQEARLRGEASPPWTVFEEDRSILQEELKRRIVALCDEPNTFTDDLLPEDWAFDMEKWAPFAAKAVEAIPKLDALRFRLVPKHVTDTLFWSRFFFQVVRLRREIGVGELVLRTEAQAADSAKAGDAAAPEMTADELERSLNEAAASASSIPAPADSGAGAADHSPGFDYLEDEFASDALTQVDLSHEGLVSQMKDALGLEAEEARTTGAPASSPPAASPSKPAAARQSPAVAEDLDQSLDEMLSGVDLSGVDTSLDAGDLDDEINASLAGL